MTVRRGRPRVGEEFTPAPQFQNLYFMYLILVIVLAFLWWWIVVLLLAPLAVAVLVGIPFLVGFCFTAYWIPKYCSTIRYTMTENEIQWVRGVWFRRTGIVPYNRITNVDVSQGPLSRRLGIASLKVQTAGYSGQSGGVGTAELHLDGIEQYQELQEAIMECVRGKKPMAVETYEPEDILKRILEELTTIRTLLEKPS
ncbi:MAG: PH domain-containing protein [Theionarchaea archaeon]|nr:PH domain-containing protein [Theionarchaea archaeon]MBU7019998.1 PH domain-containing protein [Theionarchaea archaeon]MBU7035249.1 PH domain-containing protein [Theionarchaea archaeon]